MGKVESSHDLTYGNKKKHKGLHENVFDFSDDDAVNCEWREFCFVIKLRFIYGIYVVQFRPLYCVNLKINQDHEVTNISCFSLAAAVASSVLMINFP